MGRIGKEKNLPFLINVLQKLIPDFPHIILVIAGDGPYREELQNMVKLRGLSNNVIFTGFIQKKNMNKIYAMNCGTPVVAIGKMGTKEVMHSDNGGFIVEDNLEIFTERVRQLLINPDLYQKKSIEARQFAGNWTIDKFIEKLLNLYESLVKTSEVKIKIVNIPEKLIAENSFLQLSG